jgi:hypothetical protein
MGINPTVFGPYVWAAIHLICLGAPTHLNEHQKMSYKNFFTLLPNVLPCRSCGDHLHENLQNLPIDNHLNTSDELFTWSVKLHNLVNKQLKKQSISESDAKKFWSSGPQCLIQTTGQSSYMSSNVTSNLYYIIILLIGIIIGGILNKLCFKQISKK